MNRIAAVLYFATVVSMSDIEADAQYSPRASKVGGSAAIAIEKANERPAGALTERTIQEYEKLLKAAPSDPVLQNNVGVMYFLAGRFYEAQSILRGAANRAPELSAIQVNLAVTYRKLFNPDLAVSVLRNVIQNDPSNRRAHPFLCDTFVSQERTKEAIDCYASLQRLQGLDALAVVNFGELLINAKNTKRALVMLQDADSKFPNDARVKNVLGMTLFYRKRYKEAEVHLAEAVALNPGETVVRYNIALAQMMTQKKGAAVEQYRYLKTADPELARRLYKQIFSNKLVQVGPK